MTQDTVVVIGANRGIGLEFTKQYLEAGCRVVATYRDKTKLAALHALQAKHEGALVLSHLEVTDYTEIERFSKEITHINLLVLNAGIKGYPKPGTRPLENSPEQMNEAFAVNTTGPDHLIRCLFPLLSKQENSCVVYMSSLVAEPSDNTSGGYHPYRASKLAMNGIVWNWAIELITSWTNKQPEHEWPKSPCAFSICPGWVRTDMGGTDARLSPQESISHMRTIIEHVKKTKECNALYTHDGKKPVLYPVIDALKKVFESDIAAKLYEKKMISSFANSL